MKTQKGKMNAPVLRIILSISLLLVIASGIAGFTFAHQWLTEYAVKVGRKNIDAKSSDESIQALTVTQRQLADNAQVRENANKIRLSDNHPEFTVREILNDIARKNGIKLTISSGGEDTAAGNTTTPTPQTQPATTPGAPTPTATAAVNSKTFKLTVSIQPSSESGFTEGNYKNFLQFLRDIEHSLPKIKINGVQVNAGGAATTEGTQGSPQQSPSTGSSSSSSSKTVSVNAINLEMYIK